MKLSSKWTNHEILDAVDTVLTMALHWCPISADEENTIDTLESWLREMEQPIADSPHYSAITDENKQPEI